MACWAHARREFEKALDNNKARAEKALLMIQKLYAIERKAKRGNLSAELVKELRLDESLPVINELGKWIFEEIKAHSLKVRSEKQWPMHMPDGMRYQHTCMIGIYLLTIILWRTLFAPLRSAGKITSSQEAMKQHSVQR